MRSSIHQLRLGDSVRIGHDRLQQRDMRLAQFVPACVPIADCIDWQTVALGELFLCQPELMTNAPRQRQVANAPKLRAFGSWLSYCLTEELQSTPHLVADRRLYLLRQKPVTPKQRVFF